MWPRSVSRPRSSNRTGRFPASGFPTSFTVRHTAGPLEAGARDAADRVLHRHFNSGSLALASLNHACRTPWSGFSATLPSRPREFHPEPLTDSGLETLASSGSCHHAKAVAFRRELELLLLPVGSLPTSVTCPIGIEVGRASL